MQKTFVKHSRGKALLVLTLLGAMAVLGGKARAQSADPNSTDRIVGTWRFVATGSGPNFTDYETYAPGGALSAIDNQAPSGQETVAIGTWRKVQPNKYYEEQWQLLYNPDGSFYGMWIGQIEDDMDETGKKILPSPYTYKIIDGNRKVIDSGVRDCLGLQNAETERPTELNIKRSTVLVVTQTKRLTSVTSFNLIVCPIHIDPVGRENGVSNVVSSSSRK